nr:hypothetical protein CFP56_11365 [Quercus suber]
MNDGKDDDMAVVGKVEDARDGTPSSIESTPEQEVEADASEQPAQPQKRKGGRKPIYATSEERKQRNRQAQAAFRERRTEYIKQLEATIKQNEEALSTLQQSHRTAADECLMLRYKNSLLERILLEKGIDVQAELQVKTGSPVLSAGFSRPGTANSHTQSPLVPLQRTAVKRQHARWSSGPQFLPKLAPGSTNQDSASHPTSSPQGHPTPSSHASSPNNVQTRSPLAMHQGGMTPPLTNVFTQPQQQPYQGFSRPSQQPPSSAFYAAPQQTSRTSGSAKHQSSASAVSSHSTASQHGMNASMGTSINGGDGNAVPQGQPAYYTSPFQRHIDQLEQEYDTQESRSMLDGLDQEDTSPIDAHAYPAPYTDQQAQQQTHHDYYQQTVASLAGQEQQYQHGEMIPPMPGAIDGIGAQLEAMDQQEGVGTLPPLPCDSPSLASTSSAPRTEQPSPTDSPDRKTEVELGPAFLSVRPSPRIEDMASS